MILFFNVKKAVGFKFIAAGLMVLLGFLSVGLGDFPGFGVSAEQNPEFMPISQVVPGMRGISKTVIKGMKVDTFDIEVLAILEGGLAAGDFIFIRAYGDAIEAAGGIASGMSGSPVYVDGRLIGAITHSLRDGSDPYLALVTPIGEILRVLEAQQGYNIGGNLSDYTVAINKKLKGLPNLESGTDLVMTPVKSPVIISGLRGRAFQVLADGLKTYGLEPIALGASGNKILEDPPPPEPGSALGVQLIRGDVTATVLGTVTYRKGDFIIGFGHDVLLKGDAGYIGTQAEIHHIVPSILKPYKIGSPLNVIGKVTQDRTKGVLVKLDETPKTVPVALTVKDKDTGRTEMFRADIVDDELLMGRLVSSFVLECLDSALDRIGQGTSRVEFEIHTDNLEKPISRINMFFSQMDIAAISGGEFLDILLALVDNEFAEVNITGVKVDIGIEEKRQTARIVQAETSETVVSPGETVEVRVRIHPYRGIAEIKGIKVEIPEGTPPGTLYLTVRGGGTALPDDEKEDADNKIVQRSPAESLEKLVRDMTDVEKNSDIVVEFYPRKTSELGEANLVDEEGFENSDYAFKLKPQTETEIPPRKEEKASRIENGEKIKEDHSDVVKAILSTGYVIEGEADLELIVE
ncbi:MAG: hypothetical protein GX969_08195 [Firmicutes bacterium]|jgi:hypothetical protein|nr:hypothetical protein [Bacillota bacterium]